MAIISTMNLKLKREKPKKKKKGEVSVINTRNYKRFLPESPIKKPEGWEPYTGPTMTASDLFPTGEGEFPEPDQSPLKDEVSHDPKDSEKSPGRPGPGETPASSGADIAGDPPEGKASGSGKRDTGDADPGETVKESKTPSGGRSRKKPEAEKPKTPSPSSTKRQAKKEDKKDE